jgi:hypothetical protein
MRYIEPVVVRAAPKKWIFIAQRKRGGHEKSSGIAVLQHAASANFIPRDSVRNIFKFAA